MASQRGSGILPPEVTKILYIRNLPYRISAEEMYKIFGQFGGIRQIRLGDKDNKRTRGTAFVVFADIKDAKNAVDRLTGFNVMGRYLVCNYFDPEKRAQRRSRNAKDLEAQRLEVDAIKKMYNVKTKSDLAAEKAAGGEEAMEDGD